MPTTACLLGGGEPACTGTTTVEYEQPCGMRPAPTEKSGAREAALHGRMEFVIENRIGDELERRARSMRSTVQETTRDASFAQPVGRTSSTGQLHDRQATRPGRAKAVPY